MLLQRKLCCYRKKNMLLQKKKICYRKNQNGMNNRLFRKALLWEIFVAKKGEYGWLLERILETLSHEHDCFTLGKLIRLIELKVRP